MDDKSLIRDMLDKMNGKLDEDWQSIADRVGIGIHADTLRKAGLGIKMADQAGVLCFDSIKPDSSLEVEREKLYKERCKLRDERAALNKRLRDEARLEAKIEHLEDLIVSSSKERYEYTGVDTEEDSLDNQSKILLVVISDIHYGLMINNATAYYDTDVAGDRMSEYAQRVILEGKLRGAHEVVIVLLGDLISGSIHKTVQLQNSDNVLQQMIGCSEMISDFVYGISSEFQKVSVYGVGGNHSRIDTKDDSMNDERLDNIVLWYLKTAMKPQNNVTVYTQSDTNSKDSTVCEFDIGKYLRCVAVHGDYDEFSYAGLSRLISYIGYTPDLVLCGHKHEFACMSVADTMMVRNGCVCGTGDNYTAKNRMTCSPCQTLIEINESGVISDIIPVWL